MSLPQTQVEDSRSKHRRAPIVTLVMVTYNSADVVEQALSSLAAVGKGIDFDCVVIDNASRDDSVQRIKRHAMTNQLVENDVNVGFGRANNQALPLLKGKYVLLLNPDALVPEDALTKTITFMEAHSGCGILGVKLVSADGVLQPCCRYFPTPFNLFIERTGLRSLFPRARITDDMSWAHDEVRTCDWVPGCFYLTRKEVIETIGLFDPRYFLYYEEVDHCRRAKQAGWQVMFFPDVAVVHIGGASAKSDAKLTDAGRQILPLQMESELLYFRKNHGCAVVWIHVFLMTLAGAIVAVKGLLKRRSLRHAFLKWRDIALLWVIFRRTTWGRHPTR